MKMRTMFLAAAIVCALAACKKDVAPTDAVVPADTTAVAAPTDTAAPATDPAVVAPDATLTADSTGVKECDDYLTKYMACLNDKVPAASRAAMQSGIDQMRTSWKQAAATPAGKATLAQACTAATDGAKASMKAFGCEM